MRLVVFLLARSVWGEIGADLDDAPLLQTRAAVKALSNQSEDIGALTEGGGCSAANAIFDEFWAILIACIQQWLAQQNSGYSQNPFALAICQVKKYYEDLESTSGSITSVPYLDYADLQIVHRRCEEFLNNAAAWGPKKFYCADWFGMNDACENTQDSNRRYILEVDDFCGRIPDICQQWSSQIIRSHSTGSPAKATLKALFSNDIGGISSVSAKRRKAQWCDYSIDFNNNFADKDKYLPGWRPPTVPVELDPFEGDSRTAWVKCDRSSRSCLDNLIGAFQGISESACLELCLRSDCAVLDYNDAQQKCLFYDRCRAGTVSRAKSPEAGFDRRSRNADTLGTHSYTASELIGRDTIREEYCGVGFIRIGKPRYSLYNDCTDADCRAILNRNYHDPHFASGKRGSNKATQCLCKGKSSCAGTFSFGIGSDLAIMLKGNQNMGKTCYFPRHESEMSAWKACVYVAQAAARDAAQTKDGAGFMCAKRLGVDHMRCPPEDLQQTQFSYKWPRSSIKVKCGLDSIYQCQEACKVHKDCMSYSYFPQGSGCCALVPAKGVYNNYHYGWLTLVSCKVRKGIDAMAGAENGFFEGLAGKWKRRYADATTYAKGSSSDYGQAWGHPLNGAPGTFWWRPHHVDNSAWQITCDGKLKNGGTTLGTISTEFQEVFRCRKHRRDNPPPNNGGGSSTQMRINLDADNFKCLWTDTPSYHTNYVASYMYQRLMVLSYKHSDPMYFHYEEYYQESFDQSCGFGMPLEEWCGFQCRRQGYCCNDPKDGSNQMISCSQACVLRNRGAPLVEMIGRNADMFVSEAHGRWTYTRISGCHSWWWWSCVKWVYTPGAKKYGMCKRNGGSGCSLSYGQQQFSFCSVCKDRFNLYGETTCPHGVQSASECVFGAKLKYDFEAQTTASLLQQDELEEMAREQEFTSDEPSDAVPNLCSDSAAAKDVLEEKIENEDDWHAYLSSSWNVPGVGRVVCDEHVIIDGIVHDAYEMSDFADLGSMDLKDKFPVTVKTTVLGWFDEIIRAEASSTASTPDAESLWQERSGQSYNLSDEALLSLSESEMEVSLELEETREQELTPDAPDEPSDTLPNHCSDPAVHKYLVEREIENDEDWQVYLSSPWVVPGIGKVVCDEHVIIDGIVHDALEMSDFADLGSMDLTDKFPVTVTTTLLIDEIIGESAEASPTASAPDAESLLQERSGQLHNLSDEALLSLSQSEMEVSMLRKNVQGC